MMTHTEPWILCFTCPACLLGRALGILLGIAGSIIVLALDTSTASAGERSRPEYRLYDQQSRSEGVIRETNPNIYQMYDQKSKRTGTIYVRPDGSIDMFAPDGKRIGPKIQPVQPYQAPRSK